MALLEYLLGDDGEQTVAVDIKIREVKPGDHVLYEYYRVKKTGIVQDKRCHNPNCVYVKWDGENRISFVGKYHLTPID